jgi:hypothetical protein
VSVKLDSATTHLFIYYEVLHFTFSSVFSVFGLAYINSAAPLRPPESVDRPPEFNCCLSSAFFFKKKKKTDAQLQSSTSTRLSSHSTSYPILLIYIHTRFPVPSSFFLFLAELNPTQQPFTTSLRLPHTVIITFLTPIAWFYLFLFIHTILIWIRVPFENQINHISQPHQTSTRSPHPQTSAIPVSPQWPRACSYHGNSSLLRLVYERSGNQEPPFFPQSIESINWWLFFFQKNK